MPRGLRSRPLRAEPARARQVHWILAWAEPGESPQAGRVRAVWLRSEQALGKPYRFRAPARAEQGFHAKHRSFGTERADTNVAVVAIQLVEGAAGVARGEVAASSPESRNFLGDRRYRRWVDACGRWSFGEGRDRLLALR